MEQSNIAVQGVQSDGVSGFTRMGSAAAVGNSTDAFSQIIAQMLGGFAQTEDSESETAVAQTNVQSAEIPLVTVQQVEVTPQQLEMVDTMQVNSILQQIQQLCPEDLQVLQGLGKEMRQEAPDLQSLLEELATVLDDGQTTVEATAVLTNLEELVATLQGTQADSDMEAVDDTETVNDDEDDTETNEMAVYAASALLGTIAQTWTQDTIPVQETENTSLYGQAGGMTAAAQTMETMAPSKEVVQTQMTDIAQPRQSQQVQTPVVTDNTTDTEATTTAASRMVTAQKSTDSGGNAQTQQQAEDSPKQLFDLQNGFRSTVSKVKGQLQQQETTEDTIDVDALQTQLMSSQQVRLQFATAASETKSADVLPVAEQVQQGLTTNLEQGETAFTIRLNPENLGEITVKVQEVDGKTTVHLYTASEETARTINNELHALREAVKPMAVEVHEAISQSAQGQSADTQGFDLGSQFAQQQRRQQQWSAQAQDSQAVLEDAIQQEETTQQLADNSALDTYI